MLIQIPQILVYRLTGGQDLERLYWLQEFAYEVSWTVRTR